ncbi:MAG: glycosyltransferase family 2 protein [Oscillatoriales cyanobacterium C42_A2020_001]|nr:glycosyltransferase family 2 protein [Leptolyngbyaceae cyanobacterium C42_A2020_001]
MQPLISICIPSYNGEKYFRECLDSILAQTFTDFEVLIVDDQSSDATLSIAQEYAQRDPRIKVLQNAQNLGLVGNWNRCIELAEGEWIKFVFQDDLITFDCLEKLVNATRNGVDIVVCQRQFCFETGTSKETQQHYQSMTSIGDSIGEKHFFSANEFSQIVLNRIGDNFIGEPTVTFIRKSAFQKYGKFNPRLIQLCDLEYWIRIASNTGIAYVPEYLATFRIHGSATSSNNLTRRRWRIQMDVAIMLHEFLTNPIYANLRSIASASNQVSLLALARAKTYNAWRRLSQIIEETEHPEPLLEEWKQLLEQHSSLPKIDEIPNLEKFYFELKGKTIHFKWLIQSFLKAQFQS